MINILIMDTDRADLKRLKRLLKKAAPEDNVWAFDNPTEALECAKENPIDVAFIDLGGQHIPGYFLAEQILSVQKSNIIFTNYEWEHLRDALELRVSGYLRKPLRYEELLTELQNLRYPISKENPNQTDEPEHRNNAEPDGTRRLADKLRDVITSIF